MNLLFLRLPSQKTQNTSDRDDDEGRVRDAPDTRTDAPDTAAGSTADSPADADATASPGDASASAPASACVHAMEHGPFVVHFAIEPVRELKNVLVLAGQTSPLTQRCSSSLSPRTLL